MLEYINKKHNLNSLERAWRHRKILKHKKNTNWEISDYAEMDYWYVFEDGSE